MWLLGSRLSIVPLSRAHNFVHALFFFTESVSGLRGVSKGLFITFFGGKWQEFQEAKATSLTNRFHTTFQQRFKKTLEKTREASVFCSNERSKSRWTPCRGHKAESNLHLQMNTELDASRALCALLYLQMWCFKCSCDRCFIPNQYLLVGVCAMFKETK